MLVAKRPYSSSSSSSFSSSASSSSASSSTMTTSTPTSLPDFQDAATLFHAVAMGDADSGEQALQSDDVLTQEKTAEARR